MGTNAVFPPYESYVDGKVVGIDPDIMTAVCEQLDMELVIVNIEFESLLGSVENGTIDVIAAGMSVTDERKQHVDFTQSYASTNQVVVVNGK